MKKSVSVTALRSGQFPAGCHWVPGEKRLLDISVDTLPEWLSPEEEKPKAKSKAKKGEE